MRLTKTLLFSLLFCALPALASPPWVLSGSKDGIEYSYRLGSGSLERNANGDSVITFLVLRYDSTTNEVWVRKHYVSLADCKSGSGYVVALDEHGRFLDQTAYSSSSEDPLVELAAVQCAASLDAIDIAGKAVPQG